MWLKISDALGIPRDLMQSFADVLPVYRYTVDAVFNFAKQQSWLEGVTATYATEGRMAFINKLCGTRRGIIAARAGQLNTSTNAPTRPSA